MVNIPKHNSLKRLFDWTLIVGKVGTACLFAVITGMRHQRAGYGRWGVRYIFQRVWLLGLWDIVMGQISSTQDSTWDPVKTVCSIVLARGIVLGDKMYVDGGEIVDQQYFRFGIDMPVDSGNIMRWQSESPFNQCPIFFFFSFFFF